MGHDIRMATYPIGVDKKEVQAEWDHVASCEDWQEGCTGLPQNIRWLDVVLDSEEKAEEYINKNDRGGYDQIAVKYRVYPNLKESTKYVECMNKCCSFNKKLNELRQRIHFADAKSEYIGCKHCGSKIARTYLKSNYCPVCSTDMRPETAKKRIEAAQKAYDNAQQALKQEKYNLQKKQRDASKIRWLVKIEFHV